MTALRKVIEDVSDAEHDDHDGDVVCVSHARLLITWCTPVWMLTLMIEIIIVRDQHLMIMMRWRQQH